MTIINSTDEVIVITSGERGPPGATAYDQAVADGFVGTKSEWLQSLRGGGLTGPEISSVTATGGQTVFTTPEYTVGSNLIYVYRNGLKQRLTTDYTETTSTSITLVNPATAGEIIELVAGQLGNLTRGYFSFKDYGAAGDGVTDDSAAIQACIDAVWALPGEPGFLGGYDRPKVLIDGEGKSYAVESQITFGPDTDDINGGLGSGSGVTFSNFAILATAAFADSGMVDAHSSTASTWSEEITFSNVLFDANDLADYCVEVTQCQGMRFENCHFTRFQKRGLTSGEQAFGVTLISPMIKGRGQVTGGVETNPPEYGVYWGSDGCVIGGIIRHCKYGLGMQSKNRAIGCHMYGNEYSVHVVSQFNDISHCYIEDPLYSDAGFANTRICDNLFSQSIKGGALISEDDGSGHFRGAIISGNQIAAADGVVDDEALGVGLDRYLDTGVTDLNLSATTGTAVDATIVTSTGTWMRYNEDGFGSKNVHILQGGMILEIGGPGRGIIRSVTDDQIAVIQVVKAFSTTALGLLGTGWDYKSAFLAPMTNGVFNSTAIAMTSEHLITNNVLGAAREFSTERPNQLYDVAVSTDTTISRITRESHLDTTDNNINVTLGDGAVHGQMKTVMMIEDSNTATLQVTSHAERNNIVYQFDVEGAYVTLEWNESTEEWMTISHGLLTPESFSVGSNALNVRGHTIMSTPGGDTLGQLTMNAGQLVTLHITGTFSILHETPNITLSNAGTQVVNDGNILAFYSPDGTSAIEVSRNF